MNIALKNNSAAANGSVVSGMTVNRVVSGSSEQHEGTLVDRLLRRRSALSAKELAEMLGCTSRNIQARAKRGKIPNYRVGGMVRFDPVITADWLQRSQVA
jgi:excisionase family DNA binding protein